MGKDQQKPKAIFGDQCRQKVALAIELRRAWVKTSKSQRQFLETSAAKNCLWLLLVFTHARRSSMAKATFWRHWSPKIAFGFCWSLPIELRRAWVKTSRSQRQFLETSAAKKSPWPSSFGAHG